jgi:glucose-1-phosphate adenylyltransferase
LALILAGGKGTRLEPLTRDRAKPAVPFGGEARIIDFTLSNCINSGLRRVLVLTQYKAASLDRHISRGWKFLCRELDEYIDVLPPQQRIDESWYQGTADAVYQNIYTIEKGRPEYVLILSGDHIYKMDYSKIIQSHIDSGAIATLATIPVPLSESRHFGVVKVDADWRVTGFVEKPETTEPMPDDPRRFLANMGIYVFTANALFELLCQDATDNSSSHDFGKDILPSIVGTHNVRAFPFRDENTGQTCYWRDVGTLDAYYEANLDLASVEPQLNLYEYSWPIHTFRAPFPPPKFVFAKFDALEPRVGQALNSIVCSGSVISGGRVENSIISTNVRVNSWSDIRDSILFEGVQIGRHARIRRAIIDKYVRVPERMQIGYDLEQDRARGFTISEDGIVVIGKADGYSDLGELAGLG